MLKSNRSIKAAKIDIFKSIIDISRFQTLTKIIIIKMAIFGYEDYKGVIQDYRVCITTARVRDTHATSTV